MLNNVRSIASCFVALSFVVAACGDGDEDEGGSGGSGGKGGSAGATAGTSSGKGGSAGSTAGKGGSAGSSGSGAGTAGSNAGTAGTSGSAGSGSGGEGGDDTGSGGDAGNGAAGTGDGGTPGTGGMGGDDGSGGEPEGGMGGEPTIGSGGTGTAGEGGAPVTGSGGAGGEGGAPVVEWDVIDNPGFEETDSDSVPPRHWTVTGTAGAVTYSWSTSGGAHTPDGPGFLDLWLATEYTVDVSQVVSPIPDGSYTLRIWHYGGPYTEQYVYVTGYDEANPTDQLKAPTAESAVFEEIVIDDIPVTSGQIKIGIYSVAAAGNWSHFDDVSLELSTE